MEPLVRCPVMTYLGSTEVNLKSAGGTSKQKVKKNDFMSNPEALQSARRLKLIDFIGRTRALQKCMMVSILQQNSFIAKSRGLSILVRYIGIVRYKRNNVELPHLLKIIQQNFAGSNSKGLSKSVLAIGSLSHRFQREKNLVLTQAVSLRYDN